jgi:SAM-dependent methyltransferase
MDTEAFYDRYWRSGLHRSDDWPRQRFQQVLSPLLGLERVLDYGCGLRSGYQGALASAVKEYVGADVSGVALARTRERGFKALPIAPQTGIIGVSDTTFDGAVCMEVFEHLFDPLQAAKELHRILKPGGVLVATVPNFGYHAWRLQALLRAQVPSEPEHPRKNRYNGVHIRFFSKLTFTRLLRDAGFIDVQIGSFDDASIWDVFWAAGPLACVSTFASNHFSRFVHLRFLQDLWPNVFAKRLRAIARKAE